MQCRRILDSKEITRPYIRGADWDIDTNCEMQWFIILGSTYYNYTFYQL